MTTIAIPAALAELLRQATLPARLVDEKGKIVGSFAPAGPPPEEMTAEELGELKRRMKLPGPRYSTEQVIAYLDSLEKS